MTKKYLTDYEISKNAKKINIIDVMKKTKVQRKDIFIRGDYKAKLNPQKNLGDQGKLVLVTAISPTPAGEGKTTTTIGLHDGFCQKGFNSIAAIREPSMGPVFGLKGGAAGGGNAQVVPIDDINLHFTGDIHAITAANNLISAVIDNHIFQGNELNIKSVTWRRCLDVNDRALRHVMLQTFKGEEVRKDHFDITAASEIMAVMALSSDLEDLRERLNKIIIGYNNDNNPVFLKGLNITGSILATLKDAFMPNVVQTIENNPVLVHCGPFANIAHGCNSMVATKTALQISDYVVTEAGFGSDLGAEKFLNIKSRVGNLKPGAIVLVATIRALKVHGGVELGELTKSNVDALKKGIVNIERHLQSLKTFGIPIVISINKFATDTPEEINFLLNWAKDQNIEIALSEGWEFGGKGNIDLVEKVNKVFNAKTPSFTYDVNDSIETKIEKIAKTIYGADGINISDKAKEKIELYKQWGLDKQLICVAKTPASFSDDPKKKGAPKDWSLNVKDLNISNGAGFIVVKCGSIMTMPGLNKNPQAHKIDVENNEIIGIS